MHSTNESEVKNQVAKYDAEKVGRKLKELRGIRTRIGVSRETGIPVTTLQGYEEGTRVPSPDNMICLASYYHTSVQRLFFEHK